MIGNESRIAFRQFLSIAVQIICNYAVFVFATQKGNFKFCPLPFRNLSRQSPGITDTINLTPLGILREPIKISPLG